MRAAILAWFDAAGRPLAFRSTADPWAILVSEAMAQQTQAARAADAWTGFMARFPTPASLSAATPADVLRAWRGLGYNRRALALRAAAIAIVRDHDGAAPSDLEALRRLPGVGPYTARAIAALAFGARVGAVDTNVRRVLSRAVGGARGSLDPAELQAVADAAVPADRPGHWTHALMDVGATFCRPRGPRCDACPAEPWCRAAAAGPVDDRTSPRPASPGAGRQPHPAAVSFESTTRWLRGRILDRLRDAPGDTWVELAGPIGTHDVADVGVAIDALVREGLAERDPGATARVRLPLA